MARLSLGKVSKVTLADAQATARAHFALVASKVNPSTERAKAVAKVNDTLADRIDGFRDYLRDKKERSAGHIHEVERSLRRYFVALHRFNPADVDRAMVTKELSRIRTENGPIAADRSRSHLSTFFAWLMATGVPIAFNPVSGTVTNGRKSRERLLTGDEVRPIWAALPNNDYGAIVKLLFLLGLRRTEIGELAYDEINFAAGQLELPGVRTKSGRAHITPLSSQALAILQARTPREGFVFGRDGQTVFTGWSWHKAQLDVRAGVYGWVLHDARRLMSTTLNEVLKIEPHVVEACLGHVIGGVRGTYNRAQYLDAKREALERYADYLLKLVGDTPARPKRPRRSKQETAAPAP
jgi:integrase